MLRRGRRTLEPSFSTGVHNTPYRTFFASHCISLTYSEGLTLNEGHIWIFNLPLHRIILHSIYIVFILIRQHIGILSYLEFWTFYPLFIVSVCIDTSPHQYLRLFGILCIFLWNIWTLYSFFMTFWDGPSLYILVRHHTNIRPLRVLPFGFNLWTFLCVLLRLSHGLTRLFKYFDLRLSYWWVSLHVLGWPTMPVYITCITVLLCMF